MNKDIKRIDQKPEIAVKGIPASPGIAIGPVFIYSDPALAPELRTIPRDKVNEEVRRFRKAIGASRDYLAKIHDETLRNYGKDFAEIIETQISILDDKIFLQEVEEMIQDKKLDAAYATYRIFQNKKEHFLNLSDEYFRDRAFDVQNLKRLILKHMLGKKQDVKLQQRSIVVADNLSPADTIRLHHKHILGFCTNVGGKNSHTAIVARSLGVPAIVGTEFITNIAKKDDQMLLDGNDGIIILNPGPETIREYEKKRKDFIVLGKDFLKKADKPAVTTDGHQIEVFANIEFVEELGQIAKSGAEGIGLYRTEGLFLSGNGLPSEEEQTANYLKIAESMAPKSVIIRTLDVGGDKLLPEFVSLPERNPFLGWRAIRFCLDHEEIFITQLKAILRANIHGNIRILLPMVSSLNEIRQFKKVLAKTKDILSSENNEFNPDVKIGMMVEIPSAAILAEHFAGEVDFFSIGTNDLIQYTLAVDRANEKIAHLYNHFHPAVLQLIKKVIDVGRASRIPVSMCGEMAGTPVAVPLLLGMGLEHFSAAHLRIPEIKDVIRNLSISQCRQLYQDVQTLDTAREIQKLCEDFYSGIFTESLESQNKSENESSTL